MDHREGTCGGQPQDLTGSRSPAQRRVRGASPPRHEGWVCNCRQEWSPGCPGSPGYLGIAEQLGGRKPSSTACIPSRSEADSQLHWPAQARIDVLNTMNPAEYRQWRQRRHATWIEVNRKRIHPDNDAELLIDFARRWAPYGGPAREEILVNFGMTTRRRRASVAGHSRIELQPGRDKQSHVRIPTTTGERAAPYPFGKSLAVGGWPGH